MKIYRIYGPMDIRAEEIPTPVPQKGEVLIKTAYVGMCGSDMARVIDANVPFLPNTIGHEFSAVVEQVGEGVTSLKKGDKVVIAPLLVCGECVHCKNKNPGQCVNSRFVGLRVPDCGGLAEYNVLPEINLIKLPGDMDMAQAAMIEPMTVALHGMSLMHFTPEKPLAVVGVGTIGLMAVQCAHAMGAKTIYCFDMDQKKLDNAARYGATHTFNIKEEGFLEAFFALTENYGSPQVLEAVGNEAAILLCLEIAAVGADVGIIGETREDVHIPAFNFYRRFSYHQLNLHGVYQSYTGGFPGIEFQRSIDFISKKQVTLAPLIHAIDHISTIIPYFEQVKQGKVSGKLLFYFSKDDNEVTV